MKESTKIADFYFKEKKYIYRTNWFEGVSYFFSLQSMTNEKPRKTKTKFVKIDTIRKEWATSLRSKRFFDAILCFFEHFNAFKTECFYHIFK